MNQVAISGNLTRDPELTTTAAGLAICKFGLAWNERKKDQSSGDYFDKPHFFDVTYFGRRGELMAEKAEKGNLVFVQGRLDFGSWETQEGEKRSKVGIVADSVEGEFVFKKSDGSRPAAAAAAPAAATPDDDDIPF